MKLILIDDDGTESINKEVKFVSCSFVTDENTSVINSWNCNAYDQLKGYMTVCEQFKKCENAIGLIKELKALGEWEEVKKELEDACYEHLDNDGKVISFPRRLN